jgi:hypothetical protein
MRSVILFFFVVLFTFKTNAQQNYDAGQIPKELLPYASAVVRNEEVNIEVKDLDNTLYHIQEAITVLNKNGENLAHIVVWHDKSKVIRSIKGSVYNSSGMLTSKFSEKDFEDVNATDDFSLFEDSRIKHYIPVVTDYPYTIVYEYEVRSKQSLNFNDWEPNPSTGLAVEKSRFTFTCKPDFDIRYKEINMSSKATIATNAAGFKTYTWQVNNIKAVKDEPYSPNPENILTQVKIAPVKFSYEGIAGSSNDWQELGKWIYDKLLKSRADLPAETAQHMKDITSNIADPKLKAKRIYEYMQQKTRYVSVQLGIGKYQPFFAADVDRLNYGDCKALVNYTQALLKTVNIDSYYCVVKSGSRKVSMLNDFASMNQGDHVILCIPFKNDTTWLECTNQKIPFGFLGDFTDDRTVLACTPEGGKLMHTPKYTAKANLETRKANFVISDAGELSGDMTTTFKGIQCKNREGLIEESPTERLKQIQYIYPINNMAIEKLEYKQDKSQEPVIIENIKFKARDFASANDGKIYFSLNLAKRVSNAPREIKNRVNAVDINRGYTDEDEINYTLPKGYRLEKEPINIKVDKPFGKYAATMTINGDQLVYKRRLELIDGTYTKELYQDLVDFYQKVVDEDHYNVVLIKQ